MKYKFRRISNSETQENPLFQYGIDALEDKLFPLEHIEWWGWTEKEIQLIIDNCGVLQAEEEYTYQVEGSDLLIIINNEEAQFFTANSSIKKADLILTYTEFVDFMTLFKKFVGETR